MKVRDLLAEKRQPGVITTSPGADAGSAARILVQNRIGGLPVVGSDGRLVGFLSERDYVRATLLHPSGFHDMRVEHMMQTPASTCDVDDDAHRVAVRMTRERLRHLVVLEGDSIVGMLSVGDLLKRRMEELEVEAGVLRDYVVAQRAKG